MKIYNLKEKKEFAKEYFELCSKEWGTKCNKKELNSKISNKLNKYLNGQYEELISGLLLIDDNKLIGFISLFKIDGKEHTDLTPWYATMYLKKEYRKMSYSKLLNDAILAEAKKLGYNKVYLKSELINYYEKFGAKYIEKLSNGENLYYIDLTRI